MLNFPKAVIRIIRMLNSAGFSVYAVGGCVRDALLNKQPNDWDLTTSAKPEEIKRVFKNERVIETGIQHGTVTVLMDGEGYEITTYRIDGEYTDHRRPDTVMFVDDLKEDLMRRDFTVNAMAAHPEEGVIDLFGGKEDLENRVIRAVGDPEMRFTEDALRILRAVRFASTYDFSIDEKTAKAALALAPTLENVSEERIFVELKKLLSGKGVERILLDYPGIIFTVLPELKPMHNLPQHNPHHAYDVWTHTVKTIAAAPNDPVYRLTMLFHDAGKPEKKTTDEKGVDHFIGHPLVSRDIAEKALLRLKSDKATIQTVTKLVLEHDLRVPEKRINIRRQISRIGKDLFPMLIEVIRADFRGQNPEMLEEKLSYTNSLAREYECAIEENACLTLADMKITGFDLMKVGAKGKTIGAILEKLLDDVIREKVENDPDALKKRAEMHLKNLTANP